MEASTIIGTATFLIGAILVSLGLLTLVITAIAINNLLVKYWKPVKLFNYVQEPVRVTERKPPVFDDTGLKL
jgi:hypothetical protein